MQNGDKELLAITGRKPRKAVFATVTVLLSASAFLNSSVRDAPADIPAWERFKLAAQSAEADKNFASAVTNYKQAIARLDDKTQGSEKLQLESRLVWVMLRQGTAPNRRQMLDQLVAKFEKQRASNVEDPDSELELSMLADYIREEGTGTDRIYYLSTAARIYMAMSGTRHPKLIYTAKRLSELQLGYQNLDEAVKWYEVAMKALNWQQSEHRKNELTAEMMSLRGHIALAQRDPKLASESFQKSSKLFAREAGKKSDQYGFSVFMIAVAQSQLGDTKGERTSLAEARDVMTYNLIANPAQSKVREEIVRRIMLAKIAAKRGENKLANEWYQKAYSLIKTHPTIVDEKLPDDFFFEYKQLLVSEGKSKNVADLRKEIDSLKTFEAKARHNGFERFEPRQAKP